MLHITLLHIIYTQLCYKNRKEPNRARRHWPGRAAVPSSWGDLPPPSVAHFCLAHPQAGSPVTKPQDEIHISHIIIMSTRVMLKPDWRAARAWEKEILEYEDCLPNPDIFSVASLLHAQGFHILFSSCSTHFPEQTMRTKQRWLY